MSEYIRADRADRVLVLSFARPEKKNAITLAMYDALTAHLAEAARDEAIGAVLFRGDGTMFSAGNDLLDFATVAGAGKVPENAPRFIDAIAAFPKPAIAAVQGRAVGIGTTMLLHCDHVLLAEDALLTAPFVGLGLVPEAGSSLLLTARLGHARAMAMFALGEAIDAQAALAAGIANRVVATDALDAEALAAAQAFASLPAQAFAETKRLMRDGAALASRIAEENAAFGERLRSAETAKIVAARMGAIGAKG